MSMAERPFELVLNHSLHGFGSGAISRQTFEMCETRGGMSNLTPCLPCYYAARLAVIADQLVHNELHLLRLVPLAWLKGSGLALTAIPTEFGPVTLKASLVRDGNDLAISYNPQFRTMPSRVTLHVPLIPGLKRVVLNGRTLGWNRAQRTVVVI
jgi:hypothetical protein